VNNGKAISRRKDQQAVIKALSKTEKMGDCYAEKMVGRYAEK
jgi:hypothetical protein